MATVGKVHEITREFHFEWKIDDFFSLSGANRKSYHSPTFVFAGVSWYLSIYPDGNTEDSVGYISLFLIKSSVPSISVACTFWLKTPDGKKNEQFQFTRTFDKQDTGQGRTKFLERSELSKKKSEWVPSGILTVVCSLEHCQATDNAGEAVKSKCSHCKMNIHAEYVSSHEEKCLEKPIGCPICNDVIQLNKWLDHECQVVTVKATKKLVDDVATILNNREHSDITIKVKNKEFQLHRNILAARNPYFHSMFSAEMKEKITGIVSIDDCEPVIFKAFVDFLYTGKTQTLSNGNVSALYETADKYQEDQLKEECLCFMKNKISVDTFFDFIGLALRYNEKELLQSATEFFCRNTNEIIQSAKWQIFLGEHLTAGNELYIKAFQYNVK